MSRPPGERRSEDLDDERDRGLAIFRRRDVRGLSPGALALQGLLFAVIAANLFMAVQRVRFRFFGHDEFQHTHIAWLAARGQVIYRDFFEHHGPLLALINALLLRAQDQITAVGTMVNLRLLSLACLIAIHALIYLIGRRVFGSHMLGLLAVALLSGLNYVHSGGIEIRPDLIQNVLWLLAVYLIAGDLERKPGERTRYFAAGWLLGLMLLANFKAMVGLPAVALVLTLQAVRSPVSLRQRLTPLFSVLAGTVVPLVAAGLGFAAVGALPQFLRFTTWYNFQAIEVRQHSPLNRYVDFMLTEQTGFVLAAFVGSIWLLIRIAGRDRPQAWLPQLLVLLAAGLNSILILRGLFRHNFLSFLPLFSLVAAYGLLRAHAALSRLGARRQWALSALVLILVLGQAERGLWERTPNRQGRYQAVQERFTDYLLAHTRRDEPVGHFSLNDCGGYMYNANVQYYWMSAMGGSRVYAELEGYSVFGQRYAETLERGEVSYLVGRRSDIRWLPEVTQRYIRAHYDYRNCLWKRKGIPWH